MVEDDDRRGGATPGSEVFRPAALEGMSVRAIQSYVAELRAEIARCEAAVEARGSQRAVADSFFRKPG
ncbi:DUF1192 family protein [Muricoccus radiodurans]|uniref:DUF1192 family protein n=1 Tax=Muricoccus radiodurans TaxID=2231721 RepID=UPI003CF44577